jgi:hypothetical protein
LFSKDRKKIDKQKEKKIGKETSTIQFKQVGE